MVLGEPGDRVAELVGQACLLRDLRKYFGCRLCGIARTHQIEDADFHLPLLCFCLVCRKRGRDTWGRQAPNLSSGVTLACRRSRIGGSSDRNVLDRRQPRPCAEMCLVISEPATIGRPSWSDWRRCSIPSLTSRSSIWALYAHSSCI